MPDFLTYFINYVMYTSVKTALSITTLEQLNSIEKLEKGIGSKRNCLFFVKSSGLSVFDLQSDLLIPLQVHIVNPAAR